MSNKNTKIRLGQVWTNGSCKYSIAAIIGNKAYGTNLETKVVSAVLYLNPDKTPFSIDSSWKLVTGVQDPPTRFIIPSKLVK
jgi:hypothetical protein